ncbi:MAG: hypothetical protein GKR97_16065 [Rhizobiaceae bacterium]|nr:hypothetical protein [Rhizobiaceae bacterium]
MTVICPECEARFRDPPSDVLKSRTLQCGKCEFEWKIGGEKAPRIKLDAPSLTPELSDLADDRAAIKTDLPVVMPKQQKKTPIYVDREPASQLPSKKSLALPFAILTGLMLIAGAVGLRAPIMQTLPQTVAMYQAVGLVSDNPGLKFANVVTTKVDKDGIRQLIVKGEILNIADNAVPVPPVKLIMRGREKANLYAWTVSANKDNLAAGETGRFTAVAHDFPAETVNVDIEFMPSKVLDKVSPIKSE